MSDNLKLLNLLLGRLKDLPVTFLALAAIFFGVMFYSTEIANMLSVDEYRMDYKIYIGLVFMVIVLLLLYRICSFGEREYGKRRNLKMKQKLLHQLTPEEKGYLIPYIRDKKTTLRIETDDEIIKVLRMNEIVCYVDYYNPAHSYSLSPWARKYLEKKSYLLDGHQGEPISPPEEAGKNDWMAR